MSKLIIKPLRFIALLVLLCSSFAQEGFDESAQNALIAYEVQGDELLNPQENPDAATDAELQEIMLDRDYHKVLWEDFTGLIPAPYRTSITRLTIFTDGEAELLASVTPNPDDFDTWTLALDALDGTDFSDELIHTLIHEFGHVLSLSPQEVPRNEEVLSSDEDEPYEAAEAACPTFFTGEGCSVQSSYINSFFQAFWKDIYEESFELDEGELYERYPEQFVTDYASTNPGEDIAESWTFFVLEDKPTGDSIAERKIAFFYAYPELIKLREQILNNLYE